MKLEEARRAAARQLDAVLRDVGRPLGRAPRPQIWLLLVAGATLGFWWGERGRPLKRPASVLAVPRPAETRAATTRRAGV